jgi:pullulanase
MDVVYNHVFDAETFCFNRIVPKYFSRTDRLGRCSNGSGCGNDTATERSMVKKYIVDSVKFWADEYHIDGFRFDLVGLMDTETVNAVIEAVRSDHPNVIFYGEGWSMDTGLTKPGYVLTTQRNSTMTPDLAFFNDTLRDVLRGCVFDDDLPGYVCGAPGLDDTLRRCFMGQPFWCKIPAQSINYASCHDNMTLFDRITESAPGVPRALRIRMNRLAAAICMTCQGTPFLQAGEEILRSKPLPDGTFDRNSYRSPDAVNSIKWDTLSIPEYRDTCAYYRGLIAFRQSHPVLRLTTAEAVSANVAAICGLEPNTAAFHLNGGIGGEKAQGIYVIFNATSAYKRIPLPAGRWNVCIDHQRAGTDPIAAARDSVRVAPFSAMVLVKDAAGRTPFEKRADL